MSHRSVRQSTKDLRKCLLKRRGKSTRRTGSEIDSDAETTMSAPTNPAGGQSAVEPVPAGQPGRQQNPDEPVQLPQVPVPGQHEPANVPVNGQTGIPGQQVIPGQKPATPPVVPDARSTASTPRPSKSRSRSTQRQIKELQDAIKELKRSSRSKSNSKNPSRRDRPTRRSSSRASKRKRRHSTRSPARQRRSHSRSRHSRADSRCSCSHSRSRSSRRHHHGTRRSHTRSGSRRARRRHSRSRTPHRRSRRHGGSTRRRSYSSSSSRSPEHAKRRRTASRDPSPRALRRDTGACRDAARALDSQYPKIGKPKGRRMPRSEYTLQPYNNLPHDLKKAARARKSRRDLTLAEYMCGFLFTIAKSVEPGTEIYGAITHAAQIAQDAATLLWPAVREWSQACLAHLQEKHCSWLEEDLFRHERTRLSWIQGKGKQDLKLPCPAFNTDRCPESATHVTDGFTWIHACSVCHHGAPDLSNNHTSKQCRRKPNLRHSTDDYRHDAGRRRHFNQYQKKDKPDTNSKN